MRNFCHHNEQPGHLCLLRSYHKFFSDKGAVLAHHAGLEEGKERVSVDSIDAYFAHNVKLKVKFFSQPAAVGGLASLLDMVSSAVKQLNQTYHILKMTTGESNHPKPHVLVLFIECLKTTELFNDPV